MTEVNQAETPETEDLSDDYFDDPGSPLEVAEAKPAEAPAAEDQPAPDAETAPETPEAEQPDAQQGLIAARQAEAEKRRQAETREQEKTQENEGLRAEIARLQGQFEQFQRSQQPQTQTQQEEVVPDPVLDPEAYGQWSAKQQQQTAQQAIRQHTVDMSMQRARAEHGQLADVAAAAYNAMYAQGAVDKAFNDSLTYSQHPVADVVGWYKEQMAPHFAAPQPAPQAQPAPAAPAPQMPTDISAAASPGSPPAEVSADDLWFDA